ncbi:hypothetical protein BKN38_07255 [Helicobacter sp. CLO-3]|uniref:hypothetical protein n=1 Tax=unclassified Helicobacter TaxID=2593540 RepID=UPI000805649E|nr:MULTISPECIES: hypothetical protein [unclassified Helicobacter]OBV29403.1 hypothetical protein BA723_05635 [Helicobacter sp. CLO-3]OHU82330.1 hypothetical protein BKN38_07255 [Helicobacter sp. CLO-3]
MSQETKSPVKDIEESVTNEDIKKHNEEKPIIASKVLGENGGALIAGGAASAATVAAVTPWAAGIPVVGALFAPAAAAVALPAVGVGVAAFISVKLFQRMGKKGNKLKEQHEERVERLKESEKLKK